MNEIAGQEKIRAEGQLRHEALAIDESDELRYPLEGEHIEEEPELDEEELEDLKELASSAANDIIGMYLKEMSRVPLLTMEEEISLARRRDTGLAAERNWQRNPESPRAARWQEVMRDGIAARDHLIKANTRLVVSIAKRFMTRGVPFLDLIQEGNLGLIKAVEKFDHRRGFRFSTYATWWIRQTITRAVTDQGRTIRVPFHMSDRIRRLYRVMRELEQEHAEKPSLEEIAEAMDLDLRKVQWMLKVSQQPLSLEHPVGDDDDSELGHFIENENTPSPDEDTQERMLNSTLEHLLTTLEPREAHILRMRFGLLNGRSYTLEEVGKKFGLTRERIRQIEGRALTRLRHPRRSRSLKEFL